VKRELIQKAIENNSIEWRKHALQRMFERFISRKDVKEIILSGEIIEEYQDDKPFPSALFFKMINNRPLHSVVAFDESEQKLFVITAYEPTFEKFEPDFKTRKKYE
jgi:hypothetical protein